jgi:membrane associated rhomboid family serine protease
MTYTVSRDGRNLGTYSEEGLTRQLDDGLVLPTDLVFLEKEQRWIPITELPKGEAEQAAEFTQKLETATPSAFVTPALIAINFAVFFAMAIGGVSIMNPAPTDLIHWGGDLGPLVASGEWWRLLTAAFVHVGILHIGLNMWALLAGGMFTERLFGNRGFLTLYLLSAIGGSLASIAWQPLKVSAGASGAIFGVYGGLIGLLIVQHKSIPAAAAASLSKNALAFVGYNILYGAGGHSNIDMAAHLGGLATGLAVGCALAYRVDAAAGGAKLQRSLAVTCVAMALFIPIGLKLRSRDAKQAEAVAAETRGKTLAINKSDRIIFSGMATEADARKLGQTLSLFGFMHDRGALILYMKDRAGSVVSVIVKDDAMTNPQVATAFNFIGGLISNSTGTPMRLRLLNSRRELMKEFLYERKSAGLTIP